MELFDSQIFQTPFTAQLSGPTSCGKTSLLIKILQNINLVCDKPPQRIVYCYNKFQEIFKQVPGLELHEGLPIIETFDSSINNMIILDDLMEESESNPEIQKLFTVDSHHKNISIFLITQNLFSKGKCARTISLNCHYLFIFNNPRDRLQIRCLARQMFPTNSNFLVESYDDATASRLYGYLFIDLTQKTNNKMRIQTNILPFETRLIYQPKK
jgi:hypothetical protein